MRKTKQQLSWFRRGLPPFAQFVYNSTRTCRISRILISNGSYHANLECLAVYRSRCVHADSHRTSYVFMVNQTLLPDDDDEFDEDAIPAMSYPGGGVPVTPLASSPAPLSANTKGKGRAPPVPSPLAASSSQNANGNAPRGLSGNIGAPNPASAPKSFGSNGTGTGSRQWVGGVQVETRYDLPLLKTEC